MFCQRFKLFSLQLLSFKALAKYFTPLSVTLFCQRIKLFSLQSFKALAKRFTPPSVNLLQARSKLFNSQSPSFKASAKYFTPSSANSLPVRFKLFRLQLLCFNASAKFFTPSSVNSLPARFKLFSLQLLSFKASAKYFTPLSVTLFCQRIKLFSLQSFKASAKYFTPSSVTDSLRARFKLLSVQLLSFKASAKHFTPSLVNSLSARFKLSSLQLLCFKALAKYFTPSSVTKLWLRFKLLSLQLPSLTLVEDSKNSLISLQPRQPILLPLKLIIKISLCFLRKLTIAVQSTGPSPQYFNTTALKSISLTLFCTAESSASISHKQWHNVNANCASSLLGQQATMLGSSSCSSSSYVDTGRRLVKISVSGSSRSLRSPATNCNTTCHAPSVMWLETNSRSSTSSMLSVTCFAAKNSWMVRCWKQYWALGFSRGRFASGFKSGNWWSRPQSSRFITSSDSKVNLPSLIPLKAIFPSFLKSPFTSSGSSSNGVVISSWPTVLLRYLLLCLKNISFTAQLYIWVSVVADLTKASVENEVNWVFRMKSRHEQMMKQLTGI